MQKPLQIMACKGALLQYGITISELPETIEANNLNVGDLVGIADGGAVRRGVQTRNGTGEVVSGMVVKLFGTNASTVIARVYDQSR